MPVSQIRQRIYRAGAVIGVALSVTLPIDAARSAEEVILPPGSTWEFTFSDPASDPEWKTNGDGHWTLGAAPFGTSPGLDPSFEASTNWPADGSDGDDLWVRKTIDLSGFDLSTIRWQLGVDNGFKLYINGQLAGSGNAEGYTNRWEYSGSVVQDVLLPGTNAIAVALEDHGGETAFDMQITGIRAANEIRIVGVDPPYPDLESVPRDEHFRVLVIAKVEADSEAIPVTVQIAGKETAIVVSAEPNGSVNGYLTAPIAIRPDDP